MADVKTSPSSRPLASDCAPPPPEGSESECGEVHTNSASASQQPQAIAVPPRRDNFGNIRRRFVKHSLKHGSLVFTAVSAIASVLSAWFFYYSLQTASESLKISLNGYERGYVDHLSARYAFSGDEEYLVLENSGLMPATRITARRIPYFILGDRAISAKGLGYELRQDKSLLARLRSRGILTKSADYADLMGPDREISIQALEPREETRVEVSESSNLNGIRVADAVGGVFVVQWRVTFTSGPEQTDTKQDMEFWLSHSNTRENLSDLSWGDAVIDRIEDASKRSRDYLMEVPSAPPSVTVDQSRGRH